MSYLSPQFPHALQRSDNPVFYMATGTLQTGVEEGPGGEQRGSTLTSRFCGYLPFFWGNLPSDLHVKPETSNLCNDYFLLSQGPEWGQPSRGRPEDLGQRVLVFTCKVKEIPGAPTRFREKAPGVKYITAGCQRSPSPGVTVGRKMFFLLWYSSWSFVSNLVGWVAVWPVGWKAEPASGSAGDCSGSCRQIIFPF